MIECLLEKMDANIKVMKEMVNKIKEYMKAITKADQDVKEMMQEMDTNQTMTGIQSGTSGGPYRRCHSDTSQRTEKARIGARN